MSPFLYLQSVFTTRRLALAYQKICEASDRCMTAQCDISCDSPWESSFNLDSKNILQSDADRLMEFIVLTYLQKDYSSKILAKV